MNTQIAQHELEVVTADVTLPGSLLMPMECEGVVIFAHGSGSSRSSPRNRAVAATLLERRCAALLFDLLTPQEERDRRNVFDIDLLGGRVVDATTWLRGLDQVRGLPIGLFGASTGSAAALVAAANLGDEIAAVVSRGGRPDLAGESLARVTAPTLLIVGSRDTEVLALNQQAQRRLRAESELLIIEGATHLFEEPGTLEQVADAAGRWFLDHFGKSSATRIAEDTES